MKEPQVRKRLMHELQELLRREKKLREHLRNEDGRIPDQLEDWMNVVELDDVVESLDQWTLQRIREVLSAIDRLDQGTYGKSVKSGRPIEPARLEAIPWASLTIDEARQQEGAGYPPVERTGSQRKAEPLEQGPPPGMSPGPTRSRDD